MPPKKAQSARGKTRRSERPDSPSNESASAEGPRRSAIDWVALAGIVVLAMAAYWPSYSYDFAQHDGYVWDDDDHYLNDGLINAPDGWWRIFFDPQPGLVSEQGGASVWNYWPMTRVSFWVDRHLFGDGPKGGPNLRATHVFSTLLHGLCAVLVAMVLQRMRVPGAMLAGALFAVHPVAVESVAWITERKNTVSTLFFLLALLSWLRFEASSRIRDYAATLLFFLLALLGKSATVMLPPLLVLLHWYRGGDWDGRRVLRLAPLFAMALVGGLTSIFFERVYISPGDAWSQSLGERIAASGMIAWFYLGKVLLPIGLAFNYPRFEIDAGSPLAYLPTLAAIGLAGLLFYLRKTPARHVALCLGAFVVLLFPVLGFFNLYGMRYAHVADHWQYLPCIAVIAGVAAAIDLGAGGLAARAGPRAKLVRAGQAALCVALIGALLPLTWAQSGAYKSAETLWRHTLEVRPDSAIAHGNLGTELREQGEYDEARHHFELAIEADPSFVEPYVNLGNLIDARTGSRRGAAPWWEKAIEVDPRQPVALYNLSLVAYDRGDLRACEDLLLRTLEVDPTFPLALEMLSRLYDYQRRSHEFVPYLQMARLSVAERAGAGRTTVQRIWLGFGLALSIGAVAIAYDRRLPRISDPPLISSVTEGEPIAS